MPRSHVLRHCHTLGEKPYHYWALVPKLQLGNLGSEAPASRLFGS
jgi:hypothetical protein